MQEPAVRHGKGGKGMRIEFSEIKSTSRSVDVECVLDQDESGEVLGIEILDAGLAVGLPGRLRITDARGEFPVRVSYDAEADALYITLRSARSKRQELGDANMVVGPRGELQAIELALHSRQQGNSNT
jgi:uncharacterized protein YuzE